MIVIGCGPGRCGTMSLSALLSSQLDFHVGHEAIRMPWEFDKKRIESAQRFFRAQKSGIGDCASWYLPYTKFLIQQNDSNLKVICLWRDKKGVVNSFLEKIKFKKCNHWTDPESFCYDHEAYIAHAFDMHFPKYNLPMKKAVEKYWEDYYKRAEELQKRFKGSFLILSVDKIMNDIDEQKAVLKFIGIDDNKMVMLPGLRLNKIDSMKTRYKEWSNWWEKTNGGRRNGG